MKFHDFSMKISFFGNSMTFPCLEFCKAKVIHVQISSDYNVVRLNIQ